MFIYAKNAKKHFLVFSHFLLDFSTVNMKTSTLILLVLLFVGFDIGLSHSRHRRFLQLYGVSPDWGLRLSGLGFIPVDNCFDPFNFDNKSGTQTGTCFQTGEQILMILPTFNYMLGTGLVTASDLILRSIAPLPFEIPGTYTFFLVLPFNYLTGGMPRPL